MFHVIEWDNFMLLCYINNDYCYNKNIPLHINAVLLCNYDIHIHITINLYFHVSDVRFILHGNCGLCNMPLLIPL